MTEPQFAAAWYPDPHDPSRLRWFDGAAWTEHVHPPAAPQPPVAQPVPVPVPVPVPGGATEHEPQVQHPATRQERGRFGDPEGEEILEAFYKGDKGGSLFSVRTRFRVSAGDDWRNGKATISKVRSDAPSQLQDTPEERARLRATGMDDDQIESAIAAQAKLTSILEKAAGNAIFRMAGHAALKQLAISTANGNRGDAMDIVFDGKRYRAQGDQGEHRNH